MGEVDNFEWYDAKDISNERKHGIPLRYAVILFDDPYLCETRAAKAVSEPRFAIVGSLSGRILSCVYTIRGSKRRLISLRPASRRERRVYQAEMDARRDRT